MEDLDSRIVGRRCAGGAVDLLCYQDGDLNQALHVNRLVAQPERRFLRLLGGGSKAGGNANQGASQVQRPKRKGRAKRKGRTTMEDTDDDEPIFRFQCCDGGAGGGEHRRGAKSFVGDNAAAASGQARQATPLDLLRAGSAQGAGADDDDNALIWPEGLASFAVNAQAEAAVGSCPASQSPMLSPGVLAMMEGGCEASLLGQEPRQVPLTQVTPLDAPSAAAMAQDQDSLLSLGTLDALSKVDVETPRADSANIRWLMAL